MSIINYIWKNKLVIFCAVVLIVAIVPMLYLFSGVQLALDDFSYGADTHAAFVETGSIGSVIKQAFTTTKWWYQNWQGSFVSVFLMSLHPGIYSITAYRLGLAFLFIIGLAAPVLLGFVVNKYYLKMQGKYITLIICTVIFVWTQYLPSAFEGIYWYNATVYYSFTFSISLIGISLTILFYNAQKLVAKILYLVFDVLCIIAVAGSNYPAAIFYFVIITLFIVMCFIKRIRYKWVFLSLFIIYAVVFAINVSAPGNLIRISSFGGSRSNLIYIGVMAVREFITEVADWLVALPTLAFICISIPYASEFVKNSRIRFIHPMLAACIIIVLFLIQYVVPLYAMGTTGPGRVQNVRFMIFVLGLWIFFINLFGWVHQHDQQIKISKPLAFAVVILMLCLSIRTVPVTQIWGYKAFDGIWSKQVSVLRQEMDERIEYLEQTGEFEDDYSQQACINEMLRPNEATWDDGLFWVENFYYGHVYQYR